MKKHIKFLNHSCFIIYSPEVKILCDPWFKGSAFGDGWSLLYENSHNINALDFDYIWISHEHPDHFSIATLNELDGPRKFLFQETQDKKVKSFLEKKGHEVIELKNNVTVLIGDLNLTCFVCDGFDSSLLVKFPDKKVLLNINDARVDLDNHLENKIVPHLKGENVDLLMFQFSYASWAGNKGDGKIPRYLQSKTDQKNNIVIEKISPKMVLPFASFVYFSHEENFYWNDYNWYDHVYKKYNNSNTKLVFPKPDQNIDLNNYNDQDLKKANIEALNFWLQKHENICIKHQTKGVTIQQINDKYDQFIQLLQNNNSLLSLIDKDKNFFIVIKIIDLDLVIKVGLINNSFELVQNANDEVVAEISSETTALLFSQLFARGSVTINGRIKFNYELAHRFFLFFFIPYANNIGITFNRFNKVTVKMLDSISRTSVMLSIAHFTEQSKLKMKVDIDDLFNLLDIHLEEDPSYELFNEEPPNSDI